MNKKIQTGVEKDLKNDLESMEINSRISKATVVDIVYPNKKVNYNEEFEIKLVLKLLDDTKEEIYISCPSMPEYKNSKLKNIQEYAGVNIYEFAEETIELPVKYVNDELKINYNEIVGEKDNKQYMLTQKGSEYIINAVFIYMVLLLFTFGVNLVLILLINFIYLLYWVESISLSDSDSLIKFT